MDLPPTLKQLIHALRHLPGIGTKSAERMALTLLQTSQTWPETLAENLISARQKIKPCKQCGFFSEEHDLCEICRDPQRDTTLLCIVETPHDILPIERSNIYRGLYHCLGGKLSPIEGRGPETLHFDTLFQRLKKTSPQEIILALGTDVEGEMTALYLLEQLRDHSITITQPAHGLPLGSSLDLADSLTLKRALQDRKKVNP
ncbi:MAG: recombination mediator RecR [Verrucomicrobiae bacterium]|nr:recombination mediator RecR [Verrucomicrobiae bacterium]